MKLNEFFLKIFSFGKHSTSEELDMNMNNEHTNNGIVLSILRFIIKLIIGVFKKAGQGILGFFATIIAIALLGLLLVEIFGNPVMFNFGNTARGINFSLPDNNNQIITSQSLMGEPYVMFFGSSSCINCFAEKDKIQTLRNSGVKVVGIIPNIDSARTPESIRYSDMFDIALIDQDGDFYRKMIITIVPSMLVIDKNGSPIYDVMNVASARDIKKIINITK